MTQRSQNNPRNVARQKHGDGIKGVSRKSASSAKLSSKAGASVYTSKAKKTTGERLKGSVNEDARKKQRNQERRREQALASQLNDMPEYKKWRRIWWVVLIVAVAACAVSFIVAQLRNTGTISVQVADAVAPVALALGYAGIIGALFIDLGKIRRMRKDLESQAHTMSKGQLRKLDAAIAASDKAYEEQREQRKGKGSRLPWKKDKGEDTPGTDTQ